MKKIIVEVGQKVYFDPFAGNKNENSADYLRGSVAEGTVAFINRKGNWFSVAYGKLRTSFFFDEIGKVVFHDRNLAKRAV